MIGLIPADLCGEIEIDRAEHVPVIGDGAGGHAEGLGRLEKAVEADGAVEKTELGVQVEMDEFAQRLFPLYGARRFRRYVEDNPVDARHLVDDPPGDHVEHIIRDPRPVRGHAVFDSPRCAER